MSEGQPITRGFPGWLQPRLPFFYGWVVLTAVCCAGFARQGPAVATLSIFIEPMTGEFGWSRTSLSAAVSLGGVLAAIASPLLGPILDRRGARVMLCVAVLVTGMCALLLSLTQSLIVFILLFCIARMSFASPFELGIYGAVNNWFVRKRGIATSMATFMQMMGLMAMPLIAQLTINTHGWRSGWIAIGITVLIVGFIPVWLLVVRRPEDMGIVPDGTDQTGKEIAQDSQGSPSEPAFTRAQAVRTGTFWLLSLYTLLVYPVQAGVSLHQAPHLIERGIDPTIAATIIGVFSLLSAISGLAFGAFIRHLGVRWSLMVTALFLASECSGHGVDHTILARLCCCCTVRNGYRWDVDRFAFGLGRLFWTGELWRYSRHCVGGSGGRAGSRPADFRYPARLYWQLCMVVVGVCCVFGSCNTHSCVDTCATSTSTLVGSSDELDAFCFGRSADI